ncbi:hypothetical protein WJ542_28560 [Paraburkholderia sp. B3]|uniref:hypothetical protein n=1 Tax=Paraburkholderia sp. B3 TaxID=3134791 RepID=UPI00398195C5
MPSAADRLLRVAQFACSIQSGFAAHSFSRRERAAEFLASLADRLDAVAVKLEAGEAPVSECARLGTVLDQVPAFIRTFDKSVPAQHLADTIEVDHDVLAGSEATRLKGELRCELRKLRQASDTFRTVCATVLGEL